ncbi:hepatocyte growth factor-like isoform X2 [Antedon mediterranea]|uniref:hepatocyte growth factor-like isoform X2 n=1 Tax=Antedon mediterranea TaxID=105859 RepID=UPI003AF72936
MCGDPVTLAQTETSPIIDFTCLEGIRGRYVVLRVNINDYINLCEIRVYSEDSHEISECRVTESGEDYRGIVAITRNGRVCQEWRSNTPHSHPVIQDPDKGIGDHNLCRNPDGKAGGPWNIVTLVKLTNIVHL